MPKNINNYERLNHITKLRTYIPVSPMTVLSMQDPYNQLSYNTVVSTLCKPVDNKSIRIMENYNEKVDDYLLIEYKK